MVGQGRTPAPLRFAAAALVATLLGSVARAAPAQSIVIPATAEPARQRHITLEDITNVREIGSLTLSPDGRRFAMFVRQGDVAANAYRGAWFIGDTQKGTLTFAGEGGDIRYDVRPSGHIVGEVFAPSARWSPDGRWFAYRLERNGEVQLWRSSSDGARIQQLTSSAGDVRDFVWEGQDIEFTTDLARAEASRRDEERYRQGYRYDEDLFAYTDLMLPRLRPMPSPEGAAWRLKLPGRSVRQVDDSERRAVLTRIALPTSGRQSVTHAIDGASLATASHRKGQIAWLQRGAGIDLHVVASDAPTATPIACASELCRGLLMGVWWNHDGTEVYYWRKEGIGYQGSSFYAWSPHTGVVRSLARVAEDDLHFCDLAETDRLVCARETPTRPAHVALIDLESGNIDVLADVNPEFSGIGLGRVQRIEWDTPHFAWQVPLAPLADIYPQRAYGYILYPPDFDPTRSYPVIIEPYVATGFNSSVGDEHALHVYAANGFIVLNCNFPIPLDRTGRLGGAMMSTIYSAEQSYPHLSMLAGSTLAGLDVAIAMGIVDSARVGIGGVSHGTFVPLQILQRYDRITAISISSATWGPHEYYADTARSLAAAQAVQPNGVVYQDWRQNPTTPSGHDFWHGFDIAAHVDKIEAPILMNISAEETYTLVRLIRHMRDASRAYDTYVFADETHLKWQPAHLAAIRARNLDWFRFWLQDAEDPGPAKVEQYERWRQLRKLQCRNPRSLRDYCNVVSARATIAR